MHSREAIWKEHQMAKAKKRKQQQCCKVMQAIDTIEKAAATAMKIYRVVMPIAKAILRNGRMSK
jgi:hypothetical protein